MSYATADQLLSWFGAAEVSEVAVPDDQMPIVAALLRRALSGEVSDAYSEAEWEAANRAIQRIHDALEEAQRLMDSYLATRYPLPLSETVVQASPLPRMCATVALALLHDKRLPKTLAQRQQQVLDWLHALSVGKVELVPLLAQSGRVANGPEFIAGMRLFDNDMIQAFMR
ncbi:phage protein Gp36 family protein [Candidatus Magnetaquicoccus inordinatus]|uniref:phage protein Gp36 family protein n=1 Tax=Candidatus Magnetaquicoccus inordinatus TaxID=2496818 RepID=UPI00102B2D03|nr:phage protein Gp36 family protein [Candidatus Magnetaquicoccus inordinatus]